jgi:hypothetical protein
MKKSQGKPFPQPTDEIVLRPKGILVRVAGSSRLGAYDASAVTFWSFIDSFVKPAIHSVSPQMSFLNLGNMFLRFLIPSVSFEMWMYLAFVSSESQSSPAGEEIHSFEGISCCDFNIIVNVSEGFLVIVSFLICGLDKHGILGDKLGEQIPLDLGGHPL